MISLVDVRDFSAINRALYGEDHASVARCAFLRLAFARSTAEGKPSTVMADQEPAPGPRAGCDAVA